MLYNVFYYGYIPGTQVDPPEYPEIVDLAFNSPEPEDIAADIAYEMEEREHPPWSFLIEADDGSASWESVSKFLREAEYPGEDV